MKQKDSLSSFRDWFANIASRKDREVMMEQTGIPLEIRTRRRLEKLGFASRRTYYTDDDDTSHELDFVAYKALEEVPLPYSFSVKFSLYLLGECKRSQTHDFFLFEDEDRKGIHASCIPLRFNRETFLDLRWSEAGIQFPYATERIVEVDAANYKTRDKNNYGDRITFEACNALARACRYLRRDFVEDDDFERYPLFAKIEAEFLSVLTQERDALKAVEILLKSSAQKVFEAFDFWPVRYALPLLVLDDNRGLIKTTLSPGGNVLFKEEADVALYSFVPRNITQPRDPGSWGPSEVLPVIICKYSSLDKAITMIQQGVSKIADHAKRELRDDPRMVVRDLILTQHRLNEPTGRIK